MAEMGALSQAQNPGCSVDTCTWGHGGETTGLGLQAPVRTLAKRAWSLPICLDTCIELGTARLGLGMFPGLRGEHS